MAKPWFGPEEVAAVARVVESGWVSQGEKVVEFEQVVADLVGVPHAVAVSNCTTALHLAMVVHGVGPGDEVVVPSLSFVATANAVRYVGATPVFAEVDPVTHNVTADTVAAATTPRTKAVIVVHQCGVPADVESIDAVCAPRNIAVVEDSACAIGSTLDGAPVGHHGRLAAYSFHPRKVLVTGEGGMLTTRDEGVAQRLRRLRQHGMTASSFERHLTSAPLIESYVETGFNFRMTDMQAALGVVQAGRLPAMVARRRQLAGGYHELLADVEGLQLVGDPANGTTNYQTFWAVLPDDFPLSRNELLHLLKERGVNARRGVTAAHLEPAFADLPATHLPVTERITRQSLLLPMFHELQEDELEHVSTIIIEAASRSTRTKRKGTSC